jgi:hypothetical protein
LCTTIYNYGRNFYTMTYIGAILIFQDIVHCQGSSWKGFME